MAAALVSVIGIRETILLAIVPGALAAIAITIAARQARHTLTAPEGRRPLSLNLADLRQAGLARARTPAALFELGNLATTLLILRATNLLTASAREVSLPPGPPGTSWATWCSPGNSTSGPSC